MRFISLLPVVAAAGITPVAHAQSCIAKDVAIIGGGAAGTYAAIRLREDLKKSVVLIEQADQLGGHAHTYYYKQSDGSTLPIDYGVLSYFNTTNARAFFSRFGIALEPWAAPSANQSFIDFATGKPVVPTVVGDPTAALVKYAGIVAPYNQYLFPTYNLPDPIPEDLLLSFGDFVAKYELEAAMPIFRSAHTYDNILNQTTLFLVSALGGPTLDALFSGSFMTPTSHAASQLYEKALATLGSDAVLSANVTKITRSAILPIGVTVSTAGGTTKCYTAGKLLLAIPPTAANLSPFMALDAAEADLFGRWQYQSLYGAVVRAAGLPAGTTLTNEAAGTAFNIPPPPYVDRLEWTAAAAADQVYVSRISGPSTFTPAQAAALALDGVARSGGTGGAVLAIREHTNTLMRVAPADLQAGFYSRLYALQGHQRTFYAGRSHVSDFSAIIWDYVESLLPSLAA